ncbi:MAG: hypothetical protein BAJALOKI1v1_550001 [Promethearchaeota archaeon]|nr:MAG: hypothetical protein BAJALOKI1v1_550001 [Candidatus Lokiarchaeota archaeon]
MDELYILTNDGIVLFNHVYTEKVETQLFGALLSAINSFSEEVSDGGLSNFELSSRQFILFKKNDLLFIGSSSKKVKKEIISKQLEIIAEKFIEKYPILDKKGEWDSDITIFEPFEEDIKEIFEDSVQKFWKGF